MIRVTMSSVWIFLFVLINSAVAARTDVSDEPIYPVSLRIGKP